MAVTRKKPSTGKGSSAALARTIADTWRLLRTFPPDQLDGSGGQSECPEPNDQAPKPAPQVWLEQHLEDMTDQFAEALAARLNWDTTAHAEKPILLTRAQVAATLQINVRTVDRWCRRGLLPEPMHVGGLTRWLREDLEEWIQQQGGQK